MTDLGIGHRRVVETIPFSYAGALALSTSTPWPPTRKGKIYGVRALLGTAGTSNTVITVYVNGSSVGTVTLGSGVTDNDATFTAAVDVTDVVTVGVTTLGSGSPADLTALLRVA